MSKMKHNHIRILIDKRVYSNIFREKIKVSRNVDANVIKVWKSILFQVQDQVESCVNNSVFSIINK